MQENKEIIREALELFESKGIVFRDGIRHYTIEKLVNIYEENENIIQSRIEAIDKNGDKELLDVGDLRRRNTRFKNI